jgi:hypothetical protein
MAQRKMESGQRLKIYKVQLVHQELTVLMEKMAVTEKTEVMERQLQMHQQQVVQPVQLDHKASGGQ